jgi:hypothetical protein
MSAERAVELPFDRPLLERWRPALHYDPQEPYRAISARSMTDFEGNLLVLRDGSVLARAGGVGDALLTLELLADYPGQLVATSRDRLDAAADELAAARRFQEDPAYANRAYGRIASQGGLTWLQYWLWFYYNPKHLLGAGKHEGDWELVQVGLGPSGTPKLVTCSQHETGEARGWDKVRRHDQGDGEHPLIYVAPFSHACYFEDGSHPYLGGIDNPDGSRPALMPELEELDGWKSWPGRWGNSEGVLAPVSKGKLGGRSPASPAHQGTRWKHPLSYHRDGEKVSAWRKLGRGIRFAGKASYPKLLALSAQLTGQRLVVGYQLHGSPLRAASQLYVTVHRPATAGAAEGTVGEVLLSQSKAITRRQGSVELLLPLELEQCLVVASAFNRSRQRSDPLRTTAQQAPGDGG